MLGSSSAACLDECRVCRVADQAMWSVFHQLHIFEGLGELPQRPALHERPLIYVTDFGLCSPVTLVVSAIPSSTFCAYVSLLDRLDGIV